MARQHREHRLRPRATVRKTATRIRLRPHWARDVTTGFNTVSLVHHAIQEAAGAEYDEVWCVFDKDDFTDMDFNQAVQTAHGQGFYVAYSNEAFELWYLLHFEYLDAAISRSLYIQKLHKLLGATYMKNSGDMYETLLSRQPQAIRNAERLLQNHANTTPARSCPCTTVHQLVAELNANSGD